MDTNTGRANQPTIAIVGSGPSGCYAAQFLRKQWPDAEIVVFDQLDMPYGLVRYGVAPDHPGTKAVARQFDRLFDRDGVRFVGRTLISSSPGTGDLSIDELRGAFDVVVLATGLHADRTLSSSGTALPGSQLAGVYGAGRLTRLINGHPDERADDIRLGERVVIVGQGNVAIDLLRLFLTAPEQLRLLGIAHDVVDAISSGPVREIDIVGRSEPEFAKFDVAMVKELAKLPNVRFIAEYPAAAILTGPAAGSVRRDAVDALVEASAPSATRTVRFRFGWVPEQVLGEAGVAGIAFTAAAGGPQKLSIEADAICTAIGFTEHSEAPLRRGHHESPEHVDLERGVLGDGLYCVGWLRRGPQGTIPANRVDARMVASSIVSDFTTHPSTTPKPGYAVLTRPVDTASLTHLIEELS
jgi:ferredoxin--NADP+ reductase